MSVYGIAALDIAESQMGCGETLSNNAGPDIDRYRKNGVGGAWCAAFVSYCLEEGAHKIGKPLPVARTHNAKRLFARCVKAGRKVDLPAPGDIILWHRGALGARTGHIAIVRSVHEDGSFTTIEGNRGGFPSKVREYLHEQGEALLLGFARLP
jgi:hypothetical protein